MIDLDDPDALRKEIRIILDNIKDRDSLLFCQWLIKRIVNDEPLPPIADLKNLHGAFVRVADGFRDKRKRIDPADLGLLYKHMVTGDIEIGRPLGMAVRFYREQKKLTRLQLCKRGRIPLEALLALERGQVKDMSLPRLVQLASGLGVDPGIFMEKVMEFEKQNG